MGNRNNRVRLARRLKLPVKMFLQPEHICAELFFIVFYMRRTKLPVVTTFLPYINQSSVERIVINLLIKTKRKNGNVNHIKNNDKYL